MSALRLNNMGLFRESTGLLFRPFRAVSLSSQFSGALPRAVISDPRRLGVDDVRPCCFNKCPERAKQKNFPQILIHFI